MKKKSTTSIISQFILLTLFLCCQSLVIAQKTVSPSKKYNNVAKNKEDDHVKVALIEIKQGKDAFLNNDFSRSVQLLDKNKDAKQIDAEALLDLATMYENGLGVGKNMVEAIVYYKKAADKGNTLAKIALQRLNSDLLIATNKNDTPKGSIDLQLIISEIKEGKKNYLEKNFNLSFYFLDKNKDTEQMDGDAFFYLAQQYENGLGVGKNIIEAIKYYKKAAEKGEPISKNKLQRLNNDSGSPGNNIDLISLEIKQGRHAFSENDFNRGFDLLYKNKDAGQMDGGAFFCLGYMYEYGYGVSLNTSMALSFYQKATDKGYELAKYAIQRLKIPIINDEIRQAKNACSEANYSYAFELLRKNEEFIEYDSEAMFLLAYMYETGEGTIKDYSQAAAWYRRAAVQGYAGAQNNLGLLYETGQGVEKDKSQAFYWYSKAAGNGFARAQLNMGFMYETGQGVEKNNKLAASWYHKAAKQGNAAAQNKLGDMHKEGKAVEKDDKLAVMWYRMAAKQGYAGGQLNMGIMYETGKGVKKDRKEAFEWYSKAAAQDDILAQNSLGFMYEQGRGAPKDLNKAIEFYQKAARQGSVDAQQNLKRLNKTW